MRVVIICNVRLRLMHVVLGRGGGIREREKILNLLKEDLNAMCFIYDVLL